MVQITAVHMVGGEQHEHIGSVRWTNPSTGASGENSREDMVTFLNQGNQAYVTDGYRQVDVGVVNANPPYIRTYADGVWTDNLLALPRY
jgi:Protein of unknown function (DUF3892)